jgi:hypothetical protein
VRAIWHASSAMADDWYHDDYLVHLRQEMLCASWSRPRRPGSSRNDWVGKSVSLDGGVTLSIAMPDPRCVMPTLSQGDDLPQDPNVLRTVIKSNRLELEEGARFPCAGVYAVAVSGGTIEPGRRGDSRLTSGPEVEAATPMGGVVPPVAGRVSSGNGPSSSTATGSSTSRARAAGRGPAGRVDPQRPQRRRVTGVGGQYALDAVESTANDSQGT